jgi:hypothetical protein
LRGDDLDRGAAQVKLVAVRSDRYQTRNFAGSELAVIKQSIFSFFKLPPCTLAGFDLTTHSSVPSVAGGDGTTRPQKIIPYKSCNWKVLNLISILRTSDSDLWKVEDVIPYQTSKIATKCFHIIENNFQLMDLNWFKIRRPPFTESIINSSKCTLHN